jgi:hypothetical protein
MAVAIAATLGFAVVLLLQAAPADAYDSHKVTVCHVEDGVEYEISVPESNAAHDRHLAEGRDYLGPCDGRTTTTTTTTAAPTTTTTAAQPTTPPTTSAPPTTAASPPTTAASPPTTAASPPTTAAATTTTQVRGPGTPSLVGYTWPWDDVAPCTSAECTTDPVQFGNTVGVATGGENTGVLFIAVRPADEVPLFCGDDFEGESDVVIFDATGADALGAPAEKSVAVTLLGAGTAADPYEACYGGEDEFTQKNGEPAVFDGAYWVGILPDCNASAPWPGPVLADAENPPPCVLDRVTDAETGDVTLLIVAPPGDPLVKIG